MLHHAREKFGGGVGHRRVDALPRQGGHVSVGEAARDDAFESMCRVDVDVEGDAVQRRSTRDLQTNRADLAVAASLFGEPHARASLDAVHRQVPNLAHGVDDGGLDGADPLDEIDGLAQSYNGVDDDLSGTVPRGRPRAVRADDGDRRRGNILRLRVTTGRPRRGELRNDERVLAAGEDFLVQGALKRINLRVIDQPLVEETQNLHVVIIVAGRVPC